MSRSIPFNISAGFRAAVYSVTVLWLVFLSDVVLPFLDLRSLGIQPRTLTGLRGILFSPLLHNGIIHLAANTGALFFLLIVAVAYNKRIAFVSVLIIWALSGGIVWLLGANGAIYIGASGIIFGLIGLLISVGITRHEWLTLIISLVVLFFYGGSLLSLLQNSHGISWLAHASGFVCGILAALNTQDLA